MAQIENTAVERITLSPLGRLLAVEVVSAERDLVELRLPFRIEVTTAGEVVHGGAIASLLDMTATAAAWSGADLAATPRGTTIGFSVNFIRAARGQDLIARGRVIQRGRSICFCEVDVRGEDGVTVAHALVTYKLSLGSGGAKAERA